MLRRTSSQRQAEKIYSEAIERIEKQDDPKFEFHLLLSNRSAVYLKQKKNQLALQDAERACKMNPKSVKVFVRKALALVSLKRIQEAKDVYLEASKIEPDNKFIQKMIISIEAKLPVKSFDMFMKRYKNTKDIRVRLATLATFWNASNQDERYNILRKLNALMRAKDVNSDTINAIMKCFTKEQMIDLPMKNYVDVTLPEDWVPWYKTTSKEEKVKLLGALWNACTTRERAFIAKDIDTLFKPK